MPNGAKLPLIVMLHGRGADFDSMSDLVDRLALPGVFYALPRAPYPADNSTGFEYWPRDLVMDGDTLRVEKARTFMTEKIHSVIRDVMVSAPIDSTRILIIGFSQGAAAAFVCAMEQPGLFAGLGSLAGYIPTAYSTEENLDRLAAAEISCFIGHGHNDVTVQFERARALHERLQERGSVSVLKSYPAGHEIPDEMVVDLSSWILEQIHTE
jgi:phospholipase/carboxylesterase